LRLRAKGVFLNYIPASCPIGGKYLFCIGRGGGGAFASNTDSPSPLPQNPTNKGLTLKDLPRNMVDTHSRAYFLHK
jgi:hypothetical protein